MEKNVLSILFMAAVGYVALFPMTYGHYIADAFGWGQVQPDIQKNLLNTLLLELLISRIAPAVVIAAILALLLYREGADPLYLGSLSAIIVAGPLLTLSFLPIAAAPPPNRAAAFLVFLASLAGIFFAIRRARQRGQGK